MKLLEPTASHQPDGVSHDTTLPHVQAEHLNFKSVGFGEALGWGEGTCVKHDFEARTSCLRKSAKYSKWFAYLRRIIL